MTESNRQDYAQEASGEPTTVEPRHELLNLGAGTVNIRSTNSDNSDNNDIGSRKFVAYTVKLPAEQLSALQSIWLELKRLYGAHSPDKSGMIQQAIADWLKKWDGPEHQKLLQDLLEIRQDTRRRQYRKFL
jgi:hypothetical protein